MATFNEKGAPNSRKCVAEQRAIIPNFSDTFQSSWSHSSVFALEKYPKNLNFQSFLPREEALVGTFNKKHVPTTRKYVSKQGVVTPNLSETLQSSWSRSFILALEK